MRLIKLVEKVNCQLIYQGYILVKDHSDVWPRCQEFRGLSEVSKTYYQFFIRARFLGAFTYKNRNFLLQEFQVMCMLHLLSPRHFSLFSNPIFYCPYCDLGTVYCQSNFIFIFMNFFSLSSASSHFILCCFIISSCISHVCSYFIELNLPLQY